MTTEEKKELRRLLDLHQIKSLFYTEKNNEGGTYHILRWDDKEDEWIEDLMEGEVEDSWKR